MTEADKHAKQRLAEAVKYVSRQWGEGWYRLSDGQREGFVRAEMLADIHRIARPDMDPVVFCSHVQAMAAAAMHWEGTIQ